MAAIYRVIADLAKAPSPARAWVPSLMLGASCIYMFNALIYRPSDDRAEQALAEECALWIYPTLDPADPDNEGTDLVEEPIMVPCTTSRGLYFVSAICSDEGNLRLPRARLLDRALLARLYGLPNLGDVAKALGGGILGLSARSTAHKARTANKKVTVPVTAFQSQPHFHDFNFAARGIEAHPPLAMTGDDTPMNRFHQDDDVEEPLDRAFAKLWAQFPSDIIQCSPNLRSRTQPAYVHLTVAERQDITIEFFKSFSLPFDAVYIRTCQNIAQWRALFFDKYFPPPGTSLSSTLQNFRNCTYLNAYSLELARLRPRDIPQVREALWDQFNQLRWVPHAESDRMWPTRPRPLSRLWTPLPANHQGPAVNIVVNPRFYSGPDSIYLQDNTPPLQQTLVDEDAALADMYQRVLVRQSNPDNDRSSLLGGTDALNSIRRERENASFSRHAPPREEEESSPAPSNSHPTPTGPTRRLRDEEEESSPAPSNSHPTPTGPTRRLWDEEEESSSTPSSPDIARGRVEVVSSFSQFTRGLKRQADS